MFSVCSATTDRMFNSSDQPTPPLDAQPVAEGLRDSRGRRPLIGASWTGLALLGAALAACALAFPDWLGHAPTWVVVGGVAFLVALMAQVRGARHRRR
jgi:hypothetical protein